MATALPLSTDFTGASVTEGQFKTAITSLREHVNEFNTKGTSIASAATTDIGAATTEFVDITGATTITAFGTAPAGVKRVLRFMGSLTVTHNGTTLICPFARNLSVAANDVVELRSLGAGNWIVTGGSVSPSRSMVSNGYRVMTDGSVTQWGTVTGIAFNATAQALSFPIAFPNACFSFVATGYGSIATTVFVGVNPQTLGSSGLTYDASTNLGSGTFNIRWMAIGH